MNENMRSIQRCGSQKIDFTAYGHHRDHPQAWELRARNSKAYLELIGIFFSSSGYDCVDMSSKLGSVVFGSLDRLGVENELKK